MLEKLRKMVNGVEKQDFVNMLYYETAFRKHNYPGVKRATCERSNTLGEVLGIVSQKGSCYNHLLVQIQPYGGGDVRTQLLTEPQQIEGYDLWSVIKKESAEVNLVLNYDEDKKIILVNLKQVAQAGALSYMRFSLMKPDSSEEDDCLTARSANLPLVLSMLLSYGDKGHETQIEKYEDEVVEYKIRMGQGEDLGQEGSAISQGEGEYCRYSIQDGIDMYNQNRYYDAYQVFKYHYFYSKKCLLDEQDEEAMNGYYTLCEYLSQTLFKMGFSHESYSFAMAACGMVTETQIGAIVGDANLMGRLNYYLHCSQEDPDAYTRLRQDSEELLTYVPTYLKRDYELKRPFVEDNREKVVSFISMERLFDYFHIQERDVMPSATIILNDGTVHSLKSREEICQFSLSKVLKDLTLIVPISHVCTPEELQNAKDSGEDMDTSVLCKEASFVLHLHRVPGANCLFRCDAMQTAFAGFDYEMKLDRPEPESFSAIVGTSEHISQTLDFATLIECAEMFLRQKRVMEAHEYFVYAFIFCEMMLKDEDGLFRKELQSQFGYLNSESEVPWVYNYYYLLWKIGWCLDELNQYERARAFLDRATAYQYSYDFQAEYINCLVNSRDPEALEELQDDLQEMVEEPGDEEQREAWLQHRAFLKRRMAYVLVDRKRWDEAQKLLVEMLDDPLCKEYALGELKYIKAKQQ